MSASMFSFIAVLALFRSAFAQEAAVTEYISIATDFDVLPTPTGSMAVAVLGMTIRGMQVEGYVMLEDITDLTQVHLQFGNASSTGPVALRVWPRDSMGVASQPISGNFTIPFNVTASAIAGDFNTFKGLIVSEDIYMNVHTTAFPNGEIRGQVFILFDFGPEVPESSDMAEESDMHESSDMMPETSDTDSVSDMSDLKRALPKVAQDPSARQLFYSQARAVAKRVSRKHL